MTEGKTLGVPSVKCESCEEADSSKFCIDCSQPLCSKCTKIHARLAPTKHHKPIPINEYRLLSSTKKKDSQGSHCAKHPKKPIEKLCDDCLVVLCSDCALDHKGHKIHQGSLDVNFLHRLSAQKVPGLLEIIQKLRDFEDGSPDKITLYKEAENLVKSWKDRLLDVITKDADQLLVELRDERRKQEKYQSEISSKVHECIVETDQHITKLNDSRKISDTSKLLNQLSSCDKDIEDVKVYLEKVKASQEKLKIDDILPFKDDFDKTVKMIKNVFNKSDSGKGAIALYPKLSLSSKGKPLRKIPREWKDNLKMICKTSINGANFRLCGTYTGEPKQICIFEVGGNKIKLFDMNLQAIASHTCDYNILNLICIAPDRYVTSEPFSGVQLLDERFKFLKTLFTSDEGYLPRGLHIIEENRFMVLQKHNKHYSVRFKEVCMNEHKTISVKILHEITHAEIWDGIIAYSHPGYVFYVTVADALSASITRVSTSTGESRIIHEQKAFITSICAYQDTILFGDNRGDIHLIEDGKYQGTILKESFDVVGLLPMNSGMITLTGKTLKIYHSKLDGGSKLTAVNAMIK